MIGKQLCSAAYAKIVLYHRYAMWPFGMKSLA